MNFRVGNMFRELSYSLRRNPSLFLGTLVVIAISLLILGSGLVVRSAVENATARWKDGVEFMPTPGTYYDALPDRLVALGVDEIDEDIEVLRDLEILVDGDDHHQYLLQIFLKEQAGLFGDPKAGPFFIEIIQRKGDNGFGAGNFRALFESIERAQAAEGRI